MHNLGSAAPRRFFKRFSAQNQTKGKDRSPQRHLQIRTAKTSHTAVATVASAGGESTPDAGEYGYRGSARPIHALESSAFEIERDSRR